MEEKDVQRLIDMLYNMIDEAKSAAFSAEKCTINRDEALDILDEMRSKLPLELKKAKELIAARNDYVAGAKKEVEKMMRQAELDHRFRERGHSAGPPEERRYHPPGRGAQPRAVPRGQHLYRGCPAPHGGGHSGRLVRGADLPFPVPLRLAGADAGRPGSPEAAGDPAPEAC